MNDISIGGRRDAMVRLSFDRILDYLLGPTVIGISLYGVVAALESGFAAGAVLFAQSILNIVAIALLEAWRPERSGWALHSDRTLLSDVIHSLLGSVLAGNLGKALLNALVALAAAGLAGWASVQLWPADWPFAVQCLVFLLYMECASYWWHRIMHRVPWLWRLHSIHHNPKRMHVLKAGRVHWFSGVIGTMLKFALPVALGAPAPLFIAYAAATNIFGTITHANFRHRMPDWSHYIFNTAGVHHLHHSTQLDLGNSNFGNILSVWDVVFGSFRHPRKNVLSEVGVEQAVVREDLSGELFGALLPGGLLPRSGKSACEDLNNGSNRQHP